MDPVLKVGQLVMAVEDGMEDQRKLLDILRAIVDDDFPLERVFVTATGVEILPPLENEDDEDED